MTTFVLTNLYPVITPFVAYYTLKYATGIAVDVAIDKTKNAAWYVITYPFKQTDIQCIKCKCEKCRNENCEKIDCQQGFEIIDLTDCTAKEKID